MALIQPRSSACKPYSPKANVSPDVALPFMLPRWTLRYLTRLGISGTLHPRFHIRLLFRFDTNPDFYSNLARHGMGLGGAIINIGPQGMQGHRALFISLPARQFRATQATGDLHLDPQSLHVHCRLDRPFHRPPEGHAPF